MKFSITAERRKTRKFPFYFIFCFEVAQIASLANNQPRSENSILHEKTKTKAFNYRVAQWEKFLNEYDITEQKSAQRKKIV